MSHDLSNFSIVEMWGPALTLLNRSKTFPTTAVDVIVVNDSSELKSKSDDLLLRFMAICRRSLSSIRGSIYTIFSGADLCSANGIIVNRGATLQRSTKEFIITWTGKVLL